MRTVFSLVKLNLLQIRHDRSTLLVMTVLPIMLTVLLGTMFGNSSEGKMAVAFVDLDKTAYSKQVETLLAGEKGYVLTSVTQKEGERQAADGKVAATVVVPAGFGASLESTSAKAPVIDVVKSNDPMRTASVAQVVSGIATRLGTNRLAGRTALEQLALVRTGFRLPPAGALPPGAAERVFPYATADPRPAELFAFADKLWADPPVTVRLTAVKASEERGSSILASGFEQSSLGMTVWFVLMLVLGNAEGLLEERENGTLPRLLTTPNARGTLLGGKVAGVYSIGIVQAAILIFVGALAFNVDWGSEPLAVLLLIGTFTLAATGLAIMVAAVVRTRSQAAGLGPVLAVSLSMLGGCAWPLEVVPPFMKVVAMFTPTGWAMLGLTNVVVRNRGIGAAIVPSVVMLGFALVFFAIGLSRFKFE